MYVHKSIPRIYVVLFHSVFLIDVIFKKLQIVNIHFIFQLIFDLVMLGTSVFCKRWYIWACKIKVCDIFECCFQGFQILTDRFLKLDQGCQSGEVFIILEYVRILRMWGITLWAGNLLYESCVSQFTQGYPLEARR